MFDFIIPVQNFGGGYPKKFLGAKNLQNLARFCRLQSSAANIIRMDEDIRNQWVTRSTAIPPALVVTSLVKLVQ